MIVFTVFLLFGCQAAEDTDQHDHETTHDEHGQHGDAHEQHGDDEAGHDDRHTTHDDHGHDGHDDENGVVELTPEAIERIGLETEPVVRRLLAASRVTTGQVGFDEERLAHVSARVGGRLVRVPARLGATVTASEALAVVDSMQLGEAKADFLRARARHEVATRRFAREQNLHAGQIISDQAFQEAEAVAREFATDLAAHRETLQLLGMTTAAIEQLDWTDDDASLVTIRAPFAGTIVEREATLGELVHVEDVLFTLADLSWMWLWIDLYERDLAHVQVGESVEVRLDAWPGEMIRGEIDYVDAQLDPERRTVRARVDLANPDGRLRPGMFARVTLSSSTEQASESTAIPRVALERDGERSIVFVEIEPGRYEARTVELGRASEDHVEIRSGVALGDLVVTKGSFLLKSQAAGDEIGGHHHH
ncbi:MAG: efflux RND transporter periplasmic adaptor subunit [Acidobacteriota bacterium]